MDATELLRRDHNRVRRLFAAFDEADDVATRSMLFAQIAAELRIHSRVEAEVFYPAVLRADPSEDEGEDLVAEAFDEHVAVERLINEIATLSPGDRTFVRKVQKLGKRVDSHAAEEEREMFPFAQEFLGDARLLQLGHAIETRREDLKDRLRHAPAA